LQLNLRYRSRQIRLTITPGSVTYELRGGDPIDLQHYGEIHELGVDGLTLPIPELEVRKEPSPPPGRAPR